MAPKLFLKCIFTLGERNFLPISPNCNQFSSALRENWPSERDLDDFKWVWILHSAKRDENEFEEVDSIVSCLKWIPKMLNKKIFYRKWSFATTARIHMSFNASLALMKYNIDVQYWYSHFTRRHCHYHIFCCSFLIASFFCQMLYN